MKFVLRGENCISCAPSIHYEAMNRTLILLISFTILCAGCSTSFEGIRLRATGPVIDDAFRQIAIAVDLDGYATTLSDAATRRLETAWRDLKEEERLAGSGEDAVGAVRARLTLRLAPRGRMYDVLLGLYLRYEEQHGVVKEIAAPAGHPLVTKWHRILNALVERESKEED
jgi:hypothetical protein